MPFTKIRTGQAITTYGVGAMVPLADGGSAIVAGLDKWPVDITVDITITEQRLVDICGVDGFVKPPTDALRNRDIPVIRFPSMVSCPKCKTLKRHKDFCDPSRNNCPKCDSALIPSRFVTACTAGHIDDFPYDGWVHQGSQANPTRHELFITTAGISASLRDIVISCGCDSNMKRTMDGAFLYGALKDIASCSGRIPWLPDATEPPCGKPRVVLQRGASNVWFPIYESALCIPPWSESVFRRIERIWSIYLNTVPPDLLPGSLAPFVGPGVTLDDLIRVATDRKDSANISPDDRKERIRKEEYQAIISGKEEQSQKDQFVCRTGELGPFASRWFDKVMLVEKLLEVRALR